MRALYLNTKRNFLLILILLVPIICCSCRTLLETNKTNKKDQYGKIIVLTTESDEPTIMNNLSNYLKQYAQNAGYSKEVILIPLETVRSKEDYLKELSSMYNRAENLNCYILKEIEQQNWNKQQDEFILLGYSEDGLTVLESSETLRKQINLTKVILISAPLNGYDYHKVDYGLNSGAIGQLILGMSQATLGHNSTVLEDLTPGSEYLQKRHAFIESQTGEEDLKFYIAGSSLHKLCFGGTSDTADQERIKQLDEEVSQLFYEVAQVIRAKYHTTKSTRNPDDLPGVEEYMRLWKFLEKTDRQGFYVYYKLLNGGKDHNGNISLDTQLARHITNPRVQRGVFDSYSGTLFIPYKELKDLDSLGLFKEEEYTLNDTQLYKELAKFIFDLD